MSFRKTDQADESKNETYWFSVMRNSSCWPLSCHCWTVSSYINCFKYEYKIKKNEAEYVWLFPHQDTSHLS